jgi:hypothetical protein
VTQSPHLHPVQNFSAAGLDGIGQRLNKRTGFDETLLVHLADR